MILVFNILGKSVKMRDNSNITRRGKRGGGGEGGHHAG